MKIINFILTFTICMITISCFRPNIYNDGTAWKMPRKLKTSDFYKDIEKYYQYDGRLYDYRIKVKSYLLINENNPDYKLESAFYITKKTGVNGYGEDTIWGYGFEFRRYITVENENIDENIIEEMSAFRRGYTFTKGFSKLILGEDDDLIIKFGSYHWTGWNTSDGFYENFEKDLYNKSDDILMKIIERATKFELHFDNEEDSEHFIELDNNIVLLTSDELEILKKELIELMKKGVPSREEIKNLFENENLR